MLSNNGAVEMIDEKCEWCGETLDPERGIPATVCDEECLHYLNDEQEE